MIEVEADTGEEAEREQGNADSFLSLLNQLNYATQMSHHMVPEVT